MDLRMAPSINIDLRNRYRRRRPPKQYRARHQYGRPNQTDFRSSMAFLARPPKPASLHDAVDAASYGGAVMWLLLACAWLCEDLELLDAPVRARRRREGDAAPKTKPQ